MMDCYAQYQAETGKIRLGNGRIEKIMGLNGSFLCTEKITDLKNGTVWDGKRPLWQRCPVLGAKETPAVQFEAFEEDSQIFMKPHLKAVLTLTGESGTVWYEFVIFPDIPFVFSQIFAEKKGEIDISDEKAAPLVCDGSEVQKTAGRSVVCTSDTLDCIPLGNRHLNVESVLLRAKSDINDSLVERQTVPVYARGRTLRDGCIFRISDYPRQDSLLLVKHAPVPDSALNRLGEDLMIEGTEYAAIRGTGIDFSAMPEGRIPYYASAAGVGRDSEIWDEFWRYSTASAAGGLDQALFTMSNTWGDRSRDTKICEKFMLEEIERAHRLGVDIVQIDSGWQTGIEPNSLRRSNGVSEGYYANDAHFWSPLPERFPHGLEFLVKKAAEYGIEMGLWFSPDSSDDFQNYERDVETIWGIYQKYGIRHIKLDMMKIRSKPGEIRFVKFMDELTRRSGGKICFNVDITADDRLGFLYATRYGTLYVENRYTDFVNYYPHCTFRNLWNLAAVVPPRRLQMEFLNTRRNPELYEGMPFAPSGYGMDYVFAVVMPANPLVFMELSGLAEQDVDILSKIIKKYNLYKKELFSNQVIPIGDCPSGMSFSGYLFRSEDKKSGHLLLFREETTAGSYTFCLPDSLADKEITEIYSSSPCEFQADGTSIRMNFKNQKSFIWVRYE